VQSFNYRQSELFTGFMLIIIGALSLGLVGFSTDGFAQRGYGMHHGMREWGSEYGPQSGYGPQGDWNYCPYCGRNFHGRGGYGMGPGMMGPGPGYGYGSPYGRDYGYRQQKPLDEKEAKQLVQEFLDTSRNPNLKIGGIEDKGPNFVVDIVTKEDSLVDKVAVNKDSGWIRSIY
jgi:hypothetical protein